MDDAVEESRGVEPGVVGGHLGAVESCVEATKYVFDQESPLCVCGHKQVFHRQLHYQCGICLCHKYEES